MEISLEISLRAANLEDAEIILDWENNLENWAVSNNNSAYSLIDIQVLIVSLKDVKKACQARYMIIDDGTERVLGSVDLYEIDWEQKTAGVGVLISEKEDRFKGIASRALLLLEGLAIKKWKLRRFSAEVHTTNIPSIGLFEKCNYEKKDSNSKAISRNGDYIETILFEKWLNV